MDEGEDEGVGVGEGVGEDEDVRENLSFLLVHMNLVQG